MAMEGVTATATAMATQQGDRSATATTATAMEGTMATVTAMAATVGTTAMAMESVMATQRQ